jgi:hypothetical protein
VSRGLVRRGYRRVLAPIEVQSRLRSDGNAAIARARLAEAEEAMVYMKRAPAIAAARAAIGALGPFARLHSARLLAQAQGMLALALLLKPIDEQGALQAFQRALAADPRYRPSRDHATSQVRAHFEQARGMPLPVTGPPPGSARRLGVSQLVRVTIDAAGGLGQLRVALQDHRGQVSRSREVAKVPIADLPGRALTLVTQVLDSVLEARPTVPQTATSRPAAVSPPTLPGKLPATSESTKKGRLWTWVAAGGAVAALATGAGLGLSAQADHDTWQSVRKVGKDYQRWLNLRDRGETKTLAANILFAVGGALAVTATVLFFVESPATSEKRASVTLAPGPASIQLGGSF